MNQVNFSFFGLLREFLFFPSISICVKQEENKTSINTDYYAILHNIFIFLKYVKLKGKGHGRKIFSSFKFKISM